MMLLYHPVLGNLLEKLTTCRYSLVEQVSLAKNVNVSAVSEEGRSPGFWSTCPRTLRESLKGGSHSCLDRRWLPLALLLRWLFSQVFLSALLTTASMGFARHTSQCWTDLAGILAAWSLSYCDPSALVLPAEAPADGIAAQTFDFSLWLHDFGNVILVRLFLA